MDKETNDGMTSEQQMTHLLCYLERTLRVPTFSHRLEEIHAIVVQLMECWAMYRHGERQPRLERPNEQAGRESTGGAAAGIPQAGD